MRSCTARASAIGREAVDRDAAARRHQIAGEQADEGGLAGAVRAEQTERLARLDAQVERPRARRGRRSAARAPSPRPSRRAEAARSQSLQRSEVVGPRLGDAARLADHDARHAQAREREGHRHAVVVVGVDRGAAQRAGLDRQPVRAGRGARAELAEFALERRQAVGLLDAQVRDVLDARRRRARRARRPRARAPRRETRSCRLRCR